MEYECLEMLSCNSCIRLLIFPLVVVALAVRVCSAQDCQATPAECDISQVLINCDIMNVLTSSSPSPPRLCEHYVKTWLSADGQTAKYNYTYRTAGEDDTPIGDTATATVTSNTVFTVSYGSDPSAVIKNEVLFINGAFCNVVKTNAGDMPYLLFENPYEPYDEFFKCLGKFQGYTKYKYTFVRGIDNCEKIPEKF